MQIQLDSNSDGNLIRRYEPGAIAVNGDTYYENLVLMLNALVTDLLPASIADLDGSHVEQLCELDSDVILMGTGPTLQFPPMEVLSVAYSHGKQIDVMDTAAACRTYAVLASEGRKLAAALFL